MDKDPLSEQKAVADVQREEEKSSDQKKLRDKMPGESMGEYLKRLGGRPMSVPRGAGFILSGGTGKAERNAEKTERPEKTGGEENPDARREE